MEDEELLTVKQAMAILGISKPTFYEHARHLNVGQDYKPRFRKVDILRLKDLRQKVPETNPDDAYMAKLRKQREARRKAAAAAAAASEERTWRRDILKALQGIEAALREGKDRW